MASNDLIHRFVFDDLDIRGEITTLGDSCAQVLENNRHLPEELSNLLGEFLAAVTLMSGTLKFDGVLTLQARGDGPLSMIMAECSHHRAVRGVASLDPGFEPRDLAGAGLQQLLGKAVLAIVIDPDKGERYQGIVPLESDSLAACLEHYFQNSEQLQTRFWLAAQHGAAAGIMLQLLPCQRASAGENSCQWQTLQHLAATVTPEELLQLPHSELLYRLFHELPARLYEPAAVHFQCTCSRQRSANALVSLGRREVEALLAEREVITIDCKFCHCSYVFGSADLVDLFGPDGDALH